MTMKRLLLSLALAAGAAQAAPLTVATWNLGWHLNQQEAKAWMAACSRPFTLQGELWRPAAEDTPGAQPAWSLPWGRNAPIEWDIGVLPPCDIYQAPAADGQRAVLPVTEALWAQRKARIAALLRDKIAADVIAFQEVSGAEAIRELVGADYQVCGYEGHKVQRLAFAWKASLGEGRCEVHWPLSLPERTLRDQVRPGLTLTLQREGRTVKLLTVHLKSSCVSPIDDQARTPGRGQLDGQEPNCVHLQQQVKPLEAWLDGELRTSDALVMLGDFNRNLAHEAAEPTSSPVRSSEGRTRNLWRELNDGDPKPLTLLEARCDGAVGSVCSIGRERLLARDEYGRLRGELGCRNPIGLDHMVLGGRVEGRSARKQSLGNQGETTREQLGLSDHCPVVAELEIQPVR